MPENLPAKFNTPFALASVLIASLAAFGCREPKPPAPSDVDFLPKVNQLYPTTAQAPQRTPAQVMIHRAEVAHAADVGPAWQLVSTHGIDPRDVTAWQANGFRIGMISEKNLKPFFALLPPRDHDDRTVWMTIPTDKEMDPEPVIIADGDAPRRQVTLFLPPDTLRTERMPRGRYQFLITARELSETPGTSVKLIPHLYFQELSLRPKSPVERRMDGRIFKQLELNTVITPGQYFVVAIDIPVRLPEREKTVPATQPVAPTSQPGEGQPAAESEAAQEEVVMPLSVPDSSPQFVEDDELHVGMARQLEIEWKLADLVLGLERFGTPYQAVLIFEAVPSVEPVVK